MKNVDSVIEHAVVVFGDKEEALRWLGTPVRALNYATPISPHPEPYHGVFVFHGKCSVMQTDPNGPEPSSPLEVQGRMPRLSPQ